MVEKVAEALEGVADAIAEGFDDQEDGTLSEVLK